MLKYTVVMLSSSKVQAQPAHADTHNIMAKLKINVIKFMYKDNEV